jgi:hypothetical protein
MDPTGLIVIGETEDGQTFRPSDWTERLIDAASVFGQDRRQRRDFYAGPDRRQRQTEFLTAQMLDGRKCLVIDLRLREINPEAFAYIMTFVRNHGLRIQPPQS